MGLLRPEARGISINRLLNYIDYYSERSITDYCDFQGIDIYIAGELFAYSGFSKDGVPLFSFFSHKDDPEESEYFYDAQNKLKDEVLLKERMWIKKNISTKALYQIKEALIEEQKTSNGIINQFYEYPTEAIEQGFIINLGPVFEHKNNTNITNLVQRFCLTSEIKSYIVWYKDNF